MKKLTSNKLTSIHGGECDALDAFGCGLGVAATIVSFGWLSVVGLGVACYSFYDDCTG